MYKKPTLIIVLLALVTCAYSQSAKSGKDTLAANKITNAAPDQSSSITFHLNKVAGVGPTGYSSFGISTTENLKNSNDPFYREEYKGLPQMKNKPVLDSAAEYFYVLNQPQFYFQNYVAGKYSKDFLIKKLGHLKYSVADTVNLSRAPLICYISIIAGYNSDKQPVYMVDSNNNGDFADDKLVPLLKQVMDEDMIVGSSQTVDITYLYKGQIKGGIKRVLAQLPYRAKGLDPSFVFPEFSYLRFAYKGEKYMIVTQPSNYDSFYSIVPDRPYFVGLGRSKSIKTGQFAKIGDDTFGLTAVADNGNEITLKGADISGFSSENTVSTSSAKGKAVNTSQIVSRQIGFKAPEVIGLNMNPDSKLGAAISLAKLKGKYVFLDFWTTTCIPCIQELPNIRAVYDRYKNKNLEIIGVLEERGKGSAIRLLKMHNVNWPIILTNGRTTRVTGYEDINSWPTTFLIDPTGKLIGIDLRGEALMNKLKTLIGA